MTKARKGKREPNGETKDFCKMNQKTAECNIECRNPRKIRMNCSATFLTTSIFTRLKKARKSGLLGRPEGGPHAESLELRKKSKVGEGGIQQRVTKKSIMVTMMTKRMPTMRRKKMERT